MKTEQQQQQQQQQQREIGIDMSNTGILGVDVLNAIDTKSDGTFGPDADRTFGYFVGGAQQSVILRNRGEVFAKDWELAKLIDKAEEAGGNVGVWTSESDGRIYVDHSEWVESEAEAVELAQFRKELAIWDIEAKREILVGTYVRGGYVKITRK